MFKQDYVVQNNLHGSGWKKIHHMESRHVDVVSLPITRNKVVRCNKVKLLLQTIHGHINLKQFYNLQYI